MELRRLQAGASANGTRCAVTLCDIDPSACETGVSAGEAFALIVLMALPCVTAWLGPILAAPCVPLRKRRDDDDPSLAPTRGIRATMSSYREAVDPPMFLCGIGLLPWDCGASGLLAIVLSMGVGVCVVFFGLLFGGGDLALPCGGSVFEAAPMAHGH